jgi:hypothetical protein
MPLPTRDLLIEAALVISAFKRSLADAGYPFRAPPHTERILAQINDVEREFLERTADSEQAVRLQKALKQQRRKKREAKAAEAATQGFAP